MFCLALKSNDPFFNLAIEEILLKKSREEFLILCINDRSVIIGKHQSGHREADTKFISQNHIPVIRRISGGGTVYHDPGNINFSFIRQSEPGKQVDFRKYTMPVINFLASIGIDATFGGKNDLLVENFKVSGNAEHVFHNRVLHHGTLLFRCSLDMLRKSIRKDTSKYDTRAVASNPSPVMNLYEKTNCIEETGDFMRMMLDYFLLKIPGAQPYELSGDEAAMAESLAETKYKTWEWNWAYGPEYHFRNSFGISGVEHECRMYVKDGIIRECSITGSSHMNIFSGRLIGCRHMVDDLSDLFRKEGIIIGDEEIYGFF